MAEPNISKDKDDKMEEGIVYEPTPAAESIVHVEVDGAETEADKMSPWIETAMKSLMILSLVAYTLTQVFLVNFFVRNAFVGIYAIVFYLGWYVGWWCCGSSGKSTTLTLSCVCAVLAGVFGALLFCLHVRF